MKRYINKQFVMPSASDLAALDRIGSGSGEVSSADIRELARVAANIAKHVNGLHDFLTAVGER